MPWMRPAMSASVLPGFAAAMAARCIRSVISSASSISAISLSDLTERWSATASRSFAEIPAFTSLGSMTRSSAMRKMRRSLVLRQVVDLHPLAPGLREIDAESPQVLDRLDAGVTRHVQPGVARAAPDDVVHGGRPGEQARRNPAPGRTARPGRAPAARCNRGSSNSAGTGRCCPCSCAAGACARATG